MENTITRKIEQMQEDGSMKEVEFLFKKMLTIGDRQRLFAIPRKEDGKVDGIELMFVTFASYCLEIAGQKFDFESAYNRIKNLTDWDFFIAIDAEFTKMSEEITADLEKKKINGNMNIPS